MQDFLNIFLGLAFSPFPSAIATLLTLHFWLINFMRILFAICVHLTSLLFIHYMAINLLEFNVLNILKYYSIAV